MSVPNLQYTLADLTAAVQKLDAAGQECATIKNSFNQLLGDIPGGWVGLASSTFQNVFTQFIDDYNLVVTGLNEMKADLQKAATQLHVNEQSNDSRVKRVASLLNSASTPAMASTTPPAGL